VRPLLATFLLTGAACSGFAPPTPEILRELQLNPPVHPDATRYRIHVSVDSPWLAGEFDGVILAHEGTSPMARAQLFGDVGPKVIDLLARPDRIEGYFPQTREGVDCSLPGQAVPHPLLLLGASLIEDFADIGPDRVIGVRQDERGWWLNLRPSVPGLHCEALQAKDGRTIERRFRWMYGLRWDERWESPSACTITASGLVIKVHVLGTERLESRPPRAFEFSLPDDIRVVEGSRK
jgi:hypothetical protein